jgi:hypothetical protein
MAESLGKHLLKHLEQVRKLSDADRLKKRYEKYRAHGRFLEKLPAPVESDEKQAAANHEPTAAS